MDFLEFKDQENMGLFPAMAVFPVPQSYSSQSLDSSAFLSASTSDMSLAQTPSRARRVSATLTPMTQIYESPARNLSTPMKTPMKTPNSRNPKPRMHRRSRSRLSLDASGCAVVSMDFRSPGTNPFYRGLSPAASTPLRSPNGVSPERLLQQTPLRTLSVHSLGQPFVEPQLPRSQSSVDLHSLVHSPPPELTKFDILDPKRKKITRNSPNDRKGHVCPLCGGVFQRPEHVKRHMRSHSSEKPFECGECLKKFNRADNLRAHLRKIHGMQT